MTNSQKKETKKETKLMNLTDRCKNIINTSNGTSGYLPNNNYFRTNSLGKGSYGSVYTVYDNNGNQFALKLFDKNEEDETLDLSTMREISMMRILRNNNGYEGILQIKDIINQNGLLGIIMPKFNFNLQDSIINKFFKKRKQKIIFIHHLLSAVAFLHDNNIIHRDIKSENIMINNEGLPVLIDFSIAKFLFHHNDYNNHTKISKNHTGDIGTPTYMAPEVYHNKSYGTNIDIWSLGIVILEIILNKQLPVVKDKAAFRLVKNLKLTLPDKPIPNLIRKMLTEDPNKRPEARNLLENTQLFKKYDLSTPSIKIIDPLSIAITYKNTKITINKNIKSLYRILEFENPLTLLSAIKFEQVSNICPLYCLLFAMKLFEKEQYDLEDCEELDNTLPEDISYFDLNNYKKSEFIIFDAMKYCLFNFQNEILSYKKNKKKTKKKQKKKQKK